MFWPYLDSDSWTEKGKAGESEVRTQPSYMLHIVTLYQVSHRGAPTGEVFQIIKEMKSLGRKIITRDNNSQVKTQSDLPFITNRMTAEDVKSLGD